MSENSKLTYEEMKSLSDTITEKTQEVIRSEREKLELEKELMMLRPLKNQMSQFSDSQQKQIEQGARVEYEKNKLQSKLQEISHENSLLKQDLNDLKDKMAKQVEENSQLMA